LLSERPAAGTPSGGKKQPNQLGVFAKASSDDDDANAADASGVTKNAGTHKAAGKNAAARKAAALPHFKKGIALFNDGNYRQAIDEFEKAYSIFPSPKIHLRIALCYKWLAQNLKALEYYEKFLEETPENPEDKSIRIVRKQTELEVRNLLKLVARVRMVMEGPKGAEVRINGELVGHAPLDKIKRLEPGKATVVALHKGYHPFRRELQVSSNQEAQVKIKLLEIKPKVIKEQQVVEKVIKEPPIYKKWWFWTAIGTLVAGGATGLGVWLGTREEKRELEGTPVNQDGIGLRW
jgi:tetratricopeptide (TPR) repeat protein